MRHFAADTHYIKNVFAPEDALLEEINQHLQLRNAAINIGADEGRLLQFLIKICNVKNIVEIGTLAGYSAIWMARALPEDGHLYTLEQDQKNIEAAREFIAKSDVAHKITLVEGDALTTLPTLEDKAPFDMVFMDADKFEYLKYLRWAEANTKSGSLIIGDNSFLFGAVYMDELPKGVRAGTKDVMCEFNKRLGDQSKYNSILIPTKEGITIGQRL